MPEEPREAWGADAEQVWVVANNGIFSWRDETWERSYKPKGVLLSPRIWGTAADDVWALANHTLPQEDDLQRPKRELLLLHWDGRSWEQDRPLEFAYALAGFSSSREELWLSIGAGPGSEEPRDLLLHGHDGDWDEFPGTQRDGAIIALWGAADDDVWAGGLDDPLLQRWDGDSWTDWSRKVPGQTRIGTLHGSSATNVWFGADERVHHFDGELWHSYDLPFGGVSFVHCVDAENILVAGWDSSSSGPPVETVQRWNGSGFEVVHRQDGVSEPPRRIWSSSADNVWVVGTGGILKWDGRSWKSLYAPPPRPQ